MSPTLLRFHGFLTDCLWSESFALQMWAFSTALHRVLVGTFKILEGYGYQQLVLVEKDLKGRIHNEGNYAGTVLGARGIGPVYIPSVPIKTSPTKRSVASFTLATGLIGRRT